MRGVLWNGSLPHAAGSGHRKKNKKWGFPEPKLDGNPQGNTKKGTFRESPKGLDQKVQTVECGGALLSHTLSSAVPSPCQALASGFGKGPGVSPGP